MSDGGTLKLGVRWEGAGGSAAPHPPDSAGGALPPTPNRHRAGTFAQPSVPAPLRQPHSPAFEVALPPGPPHPHRTESGNPIVGTRLQAVGKLTITLHAARGLPVGDPGLVQRGSSDPYVIFTHGAMHNAHTCVSRVVKKSLNPTWNQARTAACHTDCS